VGKGARLINEDMHLKCSLCLVAVPAECCLVASLGHPGGNITGLALGTEEGLAGKWVELLSEAVPNATRVAVLWNPGARGLELRVKELQAAAATPQAQALHFRGAQRE
jgi:ABC-type uncharacterized transport system substrate-binding protein